MPNEYRYGAYGDVEQSVAQSSAQSGTAPVYLVKVAISDLHIRTGPGTGYNDKGYIKPGVYTITEEAAGPGASKWGKLKSGAGWISLDYAKKV